MIYRNTLLGVPQFPFLLFSIYRSKTHNKPIRKRIFHGWLLRRTAFALNNNQRCYDARLLERVAQNAPRHPESDQQRPHQCNAEYSHEIPEKDHVREYSDSFQGIE